MPAENTRPCAVAGCDGPTDNWLLYTLASTHEVDVCDGHAAPLRQLAALGRRVEVVEESEAALMDQLWRKDR